MENEVSVDGKTKILGLDYKTAAILCYLPIFPVNLVASLVVLNTEPKDNHFLRFHAMQSLVMAIMFMVAGILNYTATLLFSAIPVINLLVGLTNLAVMVLAVLFFWQSIVALIAASKGEMKQIPYAGRIAEDRLSEA